MESRPNDTPHGSDAPLTVAALDLGSNSFHMMIARYGEHGLQILDRLREPVRLAGGLDAENRLSDEAQSRALACLERFGQRLRSFPEGQVRAVGTNTLRRARNGPEFRVLASETLGHPVEVISGREEARLIYLGAAHSLPDVDGRRLVVDIGGGSTEVILGAGVNLLKAHSLFMGCVTYSRAHFADGKITRDAFRAAETAAALELRGIKRSLRDAGWSVAVGTSGTILALREILKVNGWSEGAITLTALKKARKALVRAKATDRIALDGLRPDRAPVLPGGLAILIAVFKSLRVEDMGCSTGALREGVLYDLIGRIRHEDVRDRAIREMQVRYHVDPDQADRVAATALALFDQVNGAAAAWDTLARRLLEWAALVHEIGLDISYTGYHKHGAYLVTHSDLAGFATDDQLVLAALVRGHRRKLPLAAFDGVPQARRVETFRLCLLLRLAVLLHRSRTPEADPEISVGPDWARIRLRFPARWVEDHPLTLADLIRERQQLGSVGIDLVVVGGEGL